MTRVFPKPSLGNRIFDYCNIIFMMCFSLLMIYPFVNLLAISLNDGRDALLGGIYLYPRKFSIDAYVALFKSEILIRSVMISILRVAVGTTTCVFMCGLLAYVVTIRQFTGRRMIRLLFIFTMYFSGGLIPTYLLMIRLGLTNTFHVYWIPGLFVPFFMLIMSSYMQNLSESLFESARIDGAGELLIYFKIVFPLSMPVFASMAVFSSVGHWNEWFDVVLYNSGGEWDTLQVYLRRLLLGAEGMKQSNQQNAYIKLREVTPATLKAATTMIVTLPIVFVYPFFQKFFVSGITIGAVKG